VQVLEGETVKKDQVLATLIDDDAKLNLRTAESRAASLQALAEAQNGQPRIIEAEIATLKQRVAAASSKRAELEDQVERFDTLAIGGAGAVSEREVALARLQLATQEAEIATLAVSEEELRGKLRQQDAIARDFEARIAEAATEVDRRRLELDRTRILSPLDGVVLRLMAVPGQKRMLAMDDPDSSTIAILYQPGRLQARIDVPLAEAAKLAVGQPVRLQSSLLPERVFHGEVTRIVGEADLQRNTIQAKVRIADPDPRLRPEMLCRAEFLAPPSIGEDAGATVEATSGGVSLFVPEAALTGLDDRRATVWRIDESGERVAPAEVVLGQERRETYRLVVEGLKPGDRVVLDPPVDLRAGERIRPKS
jgi:RND family efflux transporter MFP subunit